MATISQAIESAIRHHQAGQLDQAAQIYRRVLEVQPRHPDALHLLGVIAYQRGNHQTAIKSIQQAIAIDPNNGGAHNNLGNALQAVGQHAAAEVHHRRAIELQPHAADAHNNLGNALKGQGKLDQAVVSFRRALQLKPDYVAAHSNLGSTYQTLGDLGSAVDCYQQALEYDPNYAGALSNLAGALHGLGRIDESIANYRLALQRDSHLPEAHLGLGKVLLDSGKFEEAVGCFQQALRIQPGCPGALHELSNLVRQRRYRFDENELATVQRNLNADNLSMDDRALLHFTLAAVMDQQQNYDQAFEHYHQGSQLRREYLRQRNIQADHEKYLKLVDAMISTFDHDFFERVKTFGMATHLPVFVVGMPRSGTTLVEQILASHPDVFGAGELRELGSISSGIASRLGTDLAYPECLHELSLEVAQDAAAQYLGHLDLLGGGALRVVDKMPLNYNHLGLIATLFPQAAVIHCKRDPRDVCLSCYMQYEIPYSLEGAAFCYAQYSRLMDHWKKVLPISILDVEYEQVVADQPLAARRMLDFCRLQWSDQCVAFYETDRAVQTPSKLQVRQPIYKSSVGRWKHYRAHLQTLCDSLGLSVDDAGQATATE